MLLWQGAEAFRLFTGKDMPAKEVMERYFQEKVTTQIKGETPDEFYLKVRDLLLSEGEVSNAIGRLTDKAYYDTLSYAEKQRYTLELSERYLHALERFKHEYEFELKGRS